MFQMQSYQTSTQAEKDISTLAVKLNLHAKGINALLALLIVAETAFSLAVNKDTQVPMITNTFQALIIKKNISILLESQFPENEITTETT